ncbi:glycosyltransferase [Citreimonas sp.]|uniref:glycosyltransferase n=1 Tax=Citreimonas sp. TaxID=3036715 RepID=UPI00405A4950
MQVIGLCRFSYPAMGGFQVEHASVEERMAYLYSVPRMEERLRHFECVCLPGLRAQTDPEFTFLILVGDSMPRHWRDRLDALLQGFPQARVVARPPGPHRQVCQDVFNEVRDMARPCLQFRHDDDDAVAVDFIAHLRQAASDSAPIVSRHRMVGFDWNRGYVARPDARGIAVNEIVNPYWGVAQAMAVGPGVKQSVLNFAHDRINRFMPTVTFTDRAMYVRGHNDHNDSRQKKHVKPVELSPLDPDGEALFRELFAIDADHVRRIFGAG